MIIPALMTASLRVRAFDGNKAGWKMSADGKSIELKDGNPIWIDANGNEAQLSGDSVARAHGDAKALRLRAEAAETALAPFKDIDPVKAKEAIGIVAKLDQKRLIDAGEVDRVKAEISTQYTGQITELQSANKDLQQRIDANAIDGIFTNSEFVRERIAVPQDMFQASFRSHFKIKDGKVEAFDKSGNRVMSKKTVGDYAEPAEALEILVDQHPQKETILRANQNSGGGGGGGGGRNGKRTMTRTEFEQLPANEAAANAAKMRSGELVVIDNPA